MADNETKKREVQTRITRFIHPDDYDSDLNEDISRLIRDVYDEMRAKARNVAEAQEQTRIEVLSWKYLFSRKRDLKDLLEKISEFVVNHDFDLYALPPINLTRGESAKIKVHWSAEEKTFRVQIPHGVRISLPGRQRLNDAIKRFCRNRGENMPRKAMRASVYPDFLEKKPKVELRFESD